MRDRADPLLWERWDEVDRILDEALDLPADVREAHVRRAAADDPELERLLLRLVDRLRTDEGSALVPDRDVVLAAFSGDDPSLYPGVGAEDMEPGTLVGPFRVLHRLGRGGMATVYEAERADGAYEQRVALKVLRRGVDTEDLLHRFLAERQILSSLNHPNIGRLLDGGAMATGRPYLVMELVDGEPITAWADRRRLDVRARVGLFLGVAEAVHAAHRQLVVHRDIKPSNIMVDAEGRVKLLDFGIAKLLTEESIHTRAGRRPLTPHYAAPEQIRGDSITTATDVYQLGLLLRELLTGVSSVAGDTDPGEPPLRPSRAAAIAVRGAPDPDARADRRQSTPRKLAAALKGDLDIIVGKAIRSDPEDRYASADELAADLRRYLHGHPIEAHGESAVYRFRKFTGRHPFFVPGFVVGQAVIAAFVVTLAGQNRQVARERDAAEAATRRAVATQEFLVDFLRTPDPNVAEPDPDITVAEALQGGRVRIAAELEEEPELKAALLDAIGRSFSGLGRYETADTVLRESLRLQRELYGDDDARLAGVLGSLGRHFLGSRDFVAADSFLNQQLRVRTAAGPMVDTALANMLGMLSSARRDMGDPDSAIALAARAESVLRSAGDTVGEYYTATLGHLAYVLRGAERLDSAEAVYREVVRRQEADTVRHPLSLALNHNNIGYLQRVREDYRGAEASYRRALEHAGQVLSDGHPTMLMYGNNLASVLEFQGRFDDVVDLAEQQIAAAEREWPEGHWRVGSAQSALGRFLLRQGRPGDAVAPLESAVRSYVETLGEAHLWTAAAQANLGVALLLSSHRREGESRLRDAHAFLQNANGGADPNVRVQLEALPPILEQAGESGWAARFLHLIPEG